MGGLQNFQNSGYGYGSCTEVTEVPLALWNRSTELIEVPAGYDPSMLCPYPGYCGTDRTELTDIPIIGMKVFQKFWVWA